MEKSCTLLVHAGARHRDQPRSPVQRRRPQNPRPQASHDALPQRRDHPPPLHHRNNLQSPNEPLIPSILANLEHRHPFVRRNAVSAVNSVYNLANGGDQMLADAPEIIERLLSTEQDQSCKRNAFLMLFSCDQDRAIRFLFTNIDRIVDWGKQLQLVVLEILGELVMDVLRALLSPNLDIQRKTLDIVIDLITPRNIDEVVMMLKKEVWKTQGAEIEKNGEYRQMLVQAIYSCAVKFPEVASMVVHPLMDFLGDSNVNSAMGVAFFMREIIQTNPKLRASIFSRLLDMFYQILTSWVCTYALWIIGEYCLSLSEVESGIATIKQCIGELPFYTASEKSEAQDVSNNTQMVNSSTVSSRRPVVLADGTYATQSAALQTTMNTPVIVPGSLASVGNLRSLIFSGDFFL